MQQPGNVDEFPKTEELSKLLECPVCTDIPFAPIHQCVQGHMLCQVCRARLMTCPECRSAFSTTRCYTIEGIVNNSQFDCKYKEHGCPQRIRGETFQKHISTCCFRNGPISTPAATSGSTQSKPTNRASSGSYSWRRVFTGDSVPDDAFRGPCLGGHSSYIGRLKTGKDVMYPVALQYPGYLKEWEQSQRRIEVLIAEPDMLRWKTAVGGAAPENAIVGGRRSLQSASEVITYVGMTMDKKSIGWMRGNKQALTFYSDTGTLKKSSEFKILVKTELGLAIDRSLVTK